MYTPVLSKNKTKDNIRELILDSVNSLDAKYGRVLTLPCLDFTLEEQLSKTLKVHTIEREKVYYEQQLHLTRDNKRITNYHGDLLDHVLNKPYHYDFAYLDLCGCINKKMVAVLTLINCNNIALTITRRRELSRWTKNSEDRDDMYDKLFSSLGYRVQTQIKYINGKSPMCTYFITKN